MRLVPPDQPVIQDPPVMMVAMDQKVKKVKRVRKVK